MVSSTRPAASTIPWRNRIVGSGEEAPDQLLVNPGNWRLHPRNQQAALAGALDTVGWVQQILVNQRTGFVVPRGPCAIVWQRVMRAYGGTGGFLRAE